MMYIVFALTIWIAIIVVSGTIYYLTSHYFTYPEIWIERIIECNGNSEEGLSPNVMFTNVAFISTGGVSSIFGAYFGIMLDSMYLKGTPYRSNETPFLMSVARLLVALLVLSPLLLPYILIKSSSPLMIVYLFKQTVPFFLAMLSLFSWVKLVHEKLGLLNVSPNK